MLDTKTLFLPRYGQIVPELQGLKQLLIFAPHVDPRALAGVDPGLVPVFTAQHRKSFRLAET